MGCTYTKLLSLANKNPAKFKIRNQKRKFQVKWSGAKHTSKCGQISWPTSWSTFFSWLVVISVKTTFTSQPQEKMVKVNSVQSSLASKLFYQAFQALAIAVVIPIVQLTFIWKSASTTQALWGLRYFCQFSQILPTRKIRGWQILSAK